MYSALTTNSLDGLISWGCQNSNFPWIAIGTAEPEASSATPTVLERGLRSALKCGLRIIDTAPNYYNGFAEESIGKVLSEIDIPRKRIGVITKAGQLTNTEMINLAGSGQMRLGQHWRFDESSIEHSVTRSLDRLRLRYLDCVLLHNPENALEEANSTVDVLGDAFDVLERLCRESKIRAWGIASWDGFFRPPGSRGSLQLAEILRHLNREYKKHNFAALELPMGLWNLTQFRSQCQFGIGARYEIMTVSEAASAFGIKIFLSSPFCGGTAIPLVEHSGSNLSSAQKALIETRKYAPDCVRIVGMRSLRSVRDAASLIKSKGNNK